MDFVTSGEAWRFPPLSFVKEELGKAACRYTDLEGSMTTFGAEDLCRLIRELGTGTIYYLLSLQTLIRQVQTNPVLKVYSKIQASSAPPIDDGDFRTRNARLDKSAIIPRPVIVSLFFQEIPIAARRAVVHSQAHAVGADVETRTSQCCAHGEGRDSERTVVPASVVVVSFFDHTQVAEL